MYNKIQLHEIVSSLKLFYFIYNIYYIFLLKASNAVLHKYSNVFIKMLFIIDINIHRIML